MLQMSHNVQHLIGLVFTFSIKRDFYQSFHYSKKKMLVCPKKEMSEMRISKITETEIKIVLYIFWVVSLRLFYFVLFFV